MWRVFFISLPLIAQTWPQWGQNPQHSGATAALGQFPNIIVSDNVYDPFVPAEQAELGGDLVVHYQAALIDGDDVFMLLKTGRWIPCDPPGSRKPAPCGRDAWNSQVWNEIRLHWENGVLVLKSVNADESRVHTLHLLEQQHECVNRKRGRRRLPR